MRKPIEPARPKEPIAPEETYTACYYIESDMVNYFEFLEKVDIIIGKCNKEDVFFQSTECACFDPCSCWPRLYIYYPAKNLKYESELKKYEKAVERYQDKMKKYEERHSQYLKDIATWEREQLPKLKAKAMKERRRLLKQVKEIEKELETNLGGIE